MYDFPQPTLEDPPKVRYITALTVREKEILEFVEAGYSNEEIGLRLHITRDCVKYHLKSIFEKLGARRRTHAVVLARQFQVLGPRMTHEGTQVRIVA